MRRPTSQVISRRAWLRGSVASGLVAAGAASVRAEEEAAAFIARAFELRELARSAGDQPYGAVVVRDGRIVGEGPSRVITGGDPTAHAEIEAIRDAARRLGTRDLGGCVMYSSSPPCPMCEAAAYWARIGRFVHGSTAIDGGRPRLTRC